MLLLLLHIVPAAERQRTGTWSHTQEEEEDAILLRTQQEAERAEEGTRALMREAYRLRTDAHVKAAEVAELEEVCG